MAITVGPVTKSVVESTVVTTNQPGLSLSLGLSLGFPLSIVKSMAITVTKPVAKSMVAKTVTVVVGLSLSLRLSLPLAVVKSMTVAVAKTTQSVSIGSQTVSQSIASIVVWISLCLGFRLCSSDGRESENY